jgi:hypothetical protein
MEISRKYNDAILNTILSKSDFEIKGRLTDSKSIFSNYFRAKISKTNIVS